MNSDLKIDMYMGVKERIVSNCGGVDPDSAHDASVDILDFLELENAKSYLTGPDRATLMDRIGRYVYAAINSALADQEAIDEESLNVAAERATEVDLMRYQLISFINEIRGIEQ